MDTTFEDPDWGNSPVFSYYQFSGTTDFKVSSSTLESSLENVKKKKDGKKAKRKLTEDVNDSLKKNKKQKYEKPKVIKSAVTPKESEVHSNITVDEENIVSKKDNESNMDKLVKKSNGKKRKNNSNKRNKYKELNIAQNQKKQVLLMNGGLEESTSTLLPAERNIETNCKERFVNNEIEECGKDTSLILDKISEVPLKKKKLKRDKLGISKSVDNKIDGKSSKIKKRKVPLPNEPEASLNPEAESEECGTAVALKKNKNKKKDSKLQSKDKSNKDRKSNDESTNDSNIKKKSNDELKKYGKVKKSKKKKSSDIKKTNKGEKAHGNKDSKDKICEDDIVNEDTVKKIEKKKSSVIKKIKSDKDEIVSGDKNSKDIDNEEVDIKLKDDLEEYLTKLDFSNLSNNTAADDSESLGTIGTVNSDSEDEYIEDEEQEKRMTSKQRFVVKGKSLGNDNTKTNESSEESDSPPVSPKKNDKSNSSSKDSSMNKREKNKLNKDILNKMLKESGTHTLDAAEALREKMTNQLNAARFRHVNEQMYTATSSEAAKLFKADPNSFVAYHTGFKSQVARWPVNPLDKIIKWLKKKTNTLTVADFGCGEAALAASVSQKVHSFDLVALNKRVTVCDMAHTPLQSKSVDVAVFCLSLMGTNIKDFILEANRVLKKGGILKIAEVESRISNANQFVDQIKKYGFNSTYSDVTTKYFYTFDFKKLHDVGKKEVCDIKLKPCKYKKR